MNTAPNSIIIDTVERLFSLDPLAAQQWIRQTKLVLDASLPYETWIRIGKALDGHSSSINWWIGDWGNFGVKNYGDKSRNAIEMSSATGIGPERIRQCMLVSAELATRVSSLSWAHHREVLALSPKLQRKMLSQASQKRWSCADLREAIRNAVADTDLIADRNGVAPAWSFSGWLMQGLRVIRQRLNDNPPENWPLEECKRHLEELGPMDEFIKRLRQIVRSYDVDKRKDG